MKPYWLGVSMLLAALGSNTAWAGETVHGAIDVPVTIDIATEETLLAPGGMSEVQITVRATSGLNDVKIRTWTRGSASISGETEIVRPYVAAGESVSFDLPVSFAAPGESGIVVEVQATIAGLGFPFSKRADLNVLLREDRAFVGMLDMKSLNRKALAHDLNTRRITSEAAAAQLRKLNTVDTVTDHPVTDHPAEAAATGGGKVTLRVEPAEPEQAKQGLDDDDAETFPNPAGGATNINVSGTVRYVDENGTTHPVFGYAVEIRDDDLIGSDLLASVATLPDGTYNETVSSGDSGGPDIFVRFRPVNSLIEVRPLGGGSYENNTAIVDDVPSDTNLVFDITFAATGDGPVGSVLSGMTYAAVYTRDALNAGAPLAQIPVEFPGATNTAFYNGSLINMRPNDRFDWDVMHHEFGHYVQDSFNFENNPGGGHNIGECLSITQGGSPAPSKDSGLLFAWGEGWPTFFGTSLQNEMGLGFTEAPRVGDAVYADTVDGFGGFSYSLETNSNNLGGGGDANGIGEDNEVTVQRIIWDLYDGPSDSRDTMTNDDLALFNVFRNTGVTRLTGAWALMRASGVVPDNQADLDAGAITTDHAVGPQPLSPTAGTIVTSSNSGFSWTRAVGCSTTFDGDLFNLRFYDADDQALLLTIPGINAPSTNISQAQILTLTASNHDVIWAVEGSNTNAPQSGPYLGDNFQIVVNTPPEADAGPDQTVECTSPTTTPVTMDGSGSSDADGDVLDYSWTAPGVVFNDPNAVGPTGQFPLGTTVATLEVSDGIQNDSDTVSIEVEDTTPPVIDCPDDITVECSATGGTPADDPQLVAFFTGVSAVDVCDTTPTITDNAPDFFLKGETIVTFFAKDDSNNASQCQAKVTVVDTTPPDISFEVTPNVLWPPNHKFWTITADITVSDICDPDPEVALVSITSDEDDNGTGDGNTTGDVKGADFGEDDREFELRAERKGNGDGRTYTIVYSATDNCGNSAEASAEVSVPHDQSGQALAWSGFVDDGTAIDPGTEVYELLIRSQGGFDATSIDVDHAYVGNHYGVQVPLDAHAMDYDEDGLLDLVLTYSAEATQALPKNSIVGLHYHAADGTDYAVPDIFLLGVPVGPFQPLPPVDSGGIQTEGEGQDKPLDLMD